jgi:hypothetical protein
VKQTSTVHIEPCFFLGDGGGSRLNGERVDTDRPSLTGRCELDDGRYYRQVVPTGQCELDDGCNYRQVVPTGQCELDDGCNYRQVVPTGQCELDDRRYYRQVVPTGQKPKRN